MTRARASTALRSSPSNVDDLTFSMTTDRPNVFQTLSAETDQRAAGVSQTNIFRLINSTLITDQKATVKTDG